MKEILQESENKYRILFEEAADSIFIIDANTGEIVDFNAAAYRNLGYSYEEFKQLQLSDIDAIETPEEIKKHVEKINEEGADNFETKLKTKDGKIRDVHINVKSIIIREKPFFIAICRDITERKLAENKIADLAKFPSENPNPVLRVYKESILYSNHAGKRLFGIQEGNSVPELLRVTVNETLESNQSQKIDIGLCDKIFSFIITPIKEAGYANIYGRDTTERKKIEEKLRESKEKFQDAYTRMIFYHNLIAHDINNVFNTIQSLIYLFHHYQNNPEKIKKLNDIINEIKEQGDRGEILIKNIRKLALMEDTQISLKRIEILDVLEESIKNLHKSFKNKEINVQVDSISNELFAQANDLLFDVYENILNNAVKYNNNPSVEIIIRIKKEENEKKKYIKMEFIDNGIGILDVRKPFIFEKNINMKDYTKGMGIGLSLVYKIIESYHGYIRVEDKINGDYSKGCNFIILIPEAL